MTRSWALSAAWWPRPGRAAARPGAGEDGLPADGCRSASRSGCARWRRCATRTARRSTAWKRASSNGGGTGWWATAWAGDSLLLTGLPGTGRTWPGPLWRGCESRARRIWCPRRTAPRRTWGWGRRRPTTGCAGVFSNLLVVTPVCH